MAILFQVLGTIVVCFLTMTMGVMFAWPSSTLTLFRSENTTLHRVMSETEATLVGSLSSIGALCGTPIAGFLLDRLGRKHTGIVFSLLSVVCWTMIASSKRVEMVLAALFVSGLAGSSFLVVPVFVGEFCQESIRGSMVSVSLLFYGVGMLLSYLMGGFLSYWHMVYASLSLSIASVCFLMILKESPTFLLSKGLEKAAAEAIAFYRSAKSNSKEVLQEITLIKRVLNADADAGATPDEEKLNPMAEKKKLSLWQYFKKSRSTRRAMFVTLVMMTTSIFQGLVVVQVYAQPLFAATVPEMSATLGTVIFAIVGVLAGIPAAYMIDAFGRKPLLIYASIGCGLCCIICGTQIHLQWGPNYLTPIFIYIFCAVYTFGAGSVPFVFYAEVFLPEIKSYVNMLVVEWAWLCNFLILVIFEPLASSIGLGPVFYLFAIICFFTALFCTKYMPETKGLAADEIQLLFTPKKYRQNVDTYK
ncbi:facilitated trehalose transporter Tret1-2 homolog [Achroia grisella]|uniref:facilitated trehalose transporter Tret1-2 homolog n=1 Tax=Achroia grisella TaxID=688607 RepID=UPI0027D2670F|nr:facilitated trehalose transporter Tret1-2 homolog [Achroia grisella]